ncbi:MAG TPA: T9SS type A sorting domain-containing protein, partial [Sunxiuqinia sp.]|nr:T9SS type A sorting domain-containing protein [Sunxiuqinia sp.]
GAQGIDPDLTEATMEVDYVRVYSNDLPKPVISGPSINAANDQVTYTVDPISGASYSWHFPDGVQVLSGETTSSVTVQWNDAPGDIQVEMQTACDTAVSNLFHVDYQSKPTANRVDILPLSDAQEMQWTSVPGNNNNFTLNAEDSALVVDFQIDNPTANAYLQYDFGGLVDLTTNYEMAFDLQIDPANSPSNMRIDLVDKNGQVKLSNLFKIDQFEADNSYHLYTHQFTTSSDGSFYLDQIKSIRIYVNYGIFGQVGSGTLRIKDLRLQNPNATTVTQIRVDPSFTVCPNPAKNWVTVRSQERIHSVQFFTLTGQLILTKSIAPVNQYRLSISRMKPGYYLLKVNGESAGKLSVY